MQYAAIAHAAPHAREIVYREPVGLASRLRGEANLTLLESVARQEHLGRYSYLACNSSATLKVVKGTGFVDGVAQADAPLALLDRLLAQGTRPHVAGLPPFQGGFAGLISYDFGRSLEPNARIPASAPLCPDMLLNRYDTVMGFDHMQERAWIVAPEARDADRLEALLKRQPAALGSNAIDGFVSNFSRTEYEKAVARTVDLILAGDIFQANISQCFSAAIPPGFDAFAFYRRLRETNPATFACFLDYGEVQVASSSPERLFAFDGRLIEARPIKGTRRRDADPARDAALIAELASSRKDRAENVMIVDLLRNDLSRVAKPGSVRVPVLCGLESYANVHHLTSVVTGELRDGRTVGDLVAAAFPGGSITGAPKIRAMEVIAEIERVPRGVYCGSIGWFGFNGQADLNIAIRTAMFSQGMARVSGGGGITARSNPAAEYDESLTKIARIMEAFAP
ncbi:MAG: aminodeoxychorismate synthase component I [Rhizobiales bacterium]|nr:aminodeoxychorismate synthase component I [Hyphomicrobiales bacterium]MBI3673266.1 aminodeoxychorismate synthase component I [Hyphomicrobiales bacterium]